LPFQESHTSILAAAALASPPTHAEALKRAAGLVERLHRLYLGTVQALQDQQRHQPPVIVRRAGQVNVAHQQVNVTATVEDR
jgi:hypothetical protein